MPKTKEFLAEVMSQRLRKAGLTLPHYFDEASEVIIFGSMSAELERPDSDIDVLCIGGRDYKFKSKLLDLIVVPLQATKDRDWLQSELATHVGRYGVWIKGKPQWARDVRIGPKAINHKCRRVSAFMNSLQISWFRLDGCFRIKYSVKLRREAQRLILLEQGIPVPPTRILDDSWPSISTSTHDVCDRLREFASESRSHFLDDLLGRVATHIQTNQIPI